MTYRLPDAALAQHTAVLGKTGAGKTTTVKGIVEHVAGDGARVCILDTIKSDHWGLTSSADGKRPGLPFHVLGGPRGHVPLHASAGKAIAELVANGELPLSILDMADFEPGGLQRFFVDFAPALLRRMRGVVYLVIEEAHLIAPKERSGIGAENMAIHWAKMLATAGRSKGIRLIVATQRTQALHNAVLGSCDTIIVHRLTAPADQAPVLTWLKANVTVEVRDRVAASLSSLPTGTGWVCSGEAKVFEKVGFPRISTFDNTATPTGDAGEIDVATAPVDQAKLRTIIGDAVQEAEENDPKALKAEIARLKAAAGKAPQVAVVDPEAVAQARQEGFDDAFARGVRAIGDLWDHLRKPLSAIQEAFEDLKNIEHQLFETVEGRAERPGPTLYDVGPEVWARLDKKELGSGSPASGTDANLPERTATTVRNPSPAASGDGTLTGPQRVLLQALAWWRAMGHPEPTRVQVAAIAGWTPKGSNLRNRLSELTTAGLVAYPRTGLVALTPAGIAAAPAPDLSRTLIDSIRAVLTGPQGQIFETLLACGRPTSREKVAQLIGWEPGGSNLRNRLSELSSLEIVEYPSRGVVGLQKWVTA